MKTCFLGSFCRCLLLELYGLFDLRSLSRSVVSVVPMSADDERPVPSMDVIRCNTTARAAGLKEARDVILSFRIRRSLADQIDNYRNVNKRLTKTQATVDLIELGLFIVQKAGALEQPELVTYLKQNLYNVQLVDDIMEWPQDRIDAILGALASERSRRIQLRFGR